MPPAAAACNMAIHCSALGATWPRSTTISVSTSTPSCRCMVSSSSGCSSKDNTKCAPDAARSRRRGLQHSQTPLRARLSEPRAIRGSPRPATCQNRRLKLSTIRGALHFLVRKYGWCGVLLEPDPQLFERLKENYSGVDGPILVNAALSPINCKTTFYRVRMDEKMPNWCALLGSFRRDVILSNKNDVPEIETHIVEDTIESISFHSLVARYKPPRIDLIVIDTEGYDLEILRQLDLIRFRPDLIVYEHKHLNERERTIAADLLIANGYSVQSTAWANTVAMRRR